MATKYGWFSQKAKDTGFHTVVYATPAGGEVEILTVTESDTEHGCGWDDIVCVGELGRWLRDGQKSQRQSC